MSLEVYFCAHGGQVPQERVARTRCPGGHVMTAATATNAALPAALPGLSVARPRPEPPCALTASAVFGWRALLVWRRPGRLNHPVPAVPPPRHARHGRAARHHVRGNWNQR